MDHLTGKLIGSYIRSFEKFRELDTDVVVTAFDAWFPQQWNALPKSPGLQLVIRGQIAYSTCGAWLLVPLL